MVCVNLRQEVFIIVQYLIRYTDTKLQKASQLQIHTLLHTDDCILYKAMQTPDGTNKPQEICVPYRIGSKSG